jgi:hypothetical protein
MVSMVSELQDFAKSSLLCTLRELNLVHLPLDPTVVGPSCSDLTAQICSSPVCSLGCLDVSSNGPDLLSATRSYGYMLLLLSFQFFPDLKDLDASKASTFSSSASPDYLGLTCFKNDSLLNFV